MKLKLIAAAAVLAVSGGANAAILTGASGNGELFFSIWDGVNSYTRDLNVTIDAFEAAIAVPGGLSFSFAADALFTSYLTTANLSTAAWNIVAGDTVGGNRAIYTYATLPAARMGSILNRSAGLGLNTFANAVNNQISPAGVDNADSAVFADGAAAYAGISSFGAFINNRLNFSTVGSAANNTYATGRNLVRVNGAPSGDSLTTYTPYADEGFAVRAFLDTGSGTLSIAAVPEPETFAMLLAGLGLMGAIARRRRNKG